MAISDTQKVDYLFKKLGFGIAKTDESAKKSPSNEAIASPLAVYSNFIWAQADQIPATAPGATTGVVEVRKVNLTLDATATVNRTFLSGMGDWIPAGFGATYAVKVYKGDPDAGGVQMFPDGSGASDEYFFDYQSGVLNFPGTNIPTGVTASNVWIKGFRYVGSKGLGSSAGISSKTYTFANIAGRDAAEVAAGDFAYVADTGEGEWALFMATTSGSGSAIWKQMVDQDASDVDARTVTQEVTFTEDTSVVLGRVSQNRRPETVAVEVVTAFDGTPVLTVGDSGNNARLMTGDDNDLSEAGVVYVTNPVHQYTAATETELRLYFTAGGNTQGHARVTVTYS